MPEIEICVPCLEHTLSTPTRRGQVMPPDMPQKTFPSCIPWGCLWKRHRRGHRCRRRACQKKPGANMLTPGLCCSKHSTAIDLLNAGAFFHPDYTVGGGIPGFWSPHSCLAMRHCYHAVCRPARGLTDATLLRHRLTAGRELRLLSHPAPKVHRYLIGLHYSEIGRMRQVSSRCASLRAALSVAACSMIALTVSTVRSMLDGPPSGAGWRPR